jgi:peptidoglycan hydrolase-like protein with peptidoglycan-binding domain
MLKKLSLGSKGVEVLHLQGLLNACPSTTLLFLQTDGIFGPKTQARVREFQRNNGLVSDGIVGPLSWKKFEQIPTRPPTGFGGPTCGTCMAANQTRWSPNLLRQLAQQAFSELSVFGAKGSGSAAPSASLPTTIRSLTAGEISMLSGTFGTSVNWATVLVSDGLGVDGRPFTVATGVPNPTQHPAIQVVNWGPGPSTSTMIHEMTHVWQSQHHPDPTRFMAIAVANQAQAAAAQAAASAIGLKTDFSAYAYVPGRRFGSYGAEQIAQQVEEGEARIIRDVNSAVGAFVGNIDSLKTGLGGFEDLLKPGVKGK